MPRVTRYLDLRLLSGLDLRLRPRPTGPLRPSTEVSVSGNVCALLVRGNFSNTEMPAVVLAKEPTTLTTPHTFTSVSSERKTLLSGSNNALAHASKHSNVRRQRGPWSPDFTC